MILKVVRNLKEKYCNTGTFLCFIIPILNFSINANEEYFKAKLINFLRKAKKCEGLGWAYKSFYQKDWKKNLPVCSRQG